MVFKKGFLCFVLLFGTLGFRLPMLRKSKSCKEERRQLKVTTTKFERPKTATSSPTQEDNRHPSPLHNFFIEKRRSWSSSVRLLPRLHRGSSSEGKRLESPEEESSKTTFPWPSISSSSWRPPILQVKRHSSNPLHFTRPQRRRSMTVEPPDPPPRLIPTALLDPVLRRRSSCPSLERLIPHNDGSALSLADIREKSKPGVTVLRQRKDTRSPSCSSSSSSSSSSSAAEEEETSEIPNVLDPVTHKPVLKISNIPPRSMRMRRRTSKRKERKALQVWRSSLEQSLAELAHLNVPSVVRAFSGPGKEGRTHVLVM